MMLALWIGWQIVGWSAGVAAVIVVVIVLCAARAAGAALQSGDEDYR